MRIPDDARTGVYLVRVRAGGRRAVWPVVVNGRPAGGRRALSRPRPLVILPVATWQGVNQWDSDADGFPDTLSDATSVPADRPYAGGKVPRGLTAARPLLEFLDRERLSYDLTTDVALARRQGPSLSNAPGVAIAGTARWVPRQLRDGLRREVEDEGLGVVVVRRPLAARHGGRGRRAAGEPQPAPARRPVRRAHPDPAPGRRRAAEPAGGPPARVRRHRPAVRRLLAPGGVHVAARRRRAAERRGPRGGGPPGLRGLPLRQGHRDPPGHAAVAGPAGRGRPRPGGPADHRERVARAPRARAEGAGP